MVKVGGSQKTKKNYNREKFINFAEIRGIFNMHHWLRGMDAPEVEKSHDVVDCNHTGTRNRKRNRNLKISKVLLKSKAHQGTSLFTSAATNQKGFPKGGQEKLRFDFQNTKRGQSSC